MYQISSNARRLDLEWIHRSLAGSYWAKGIPRRIVARSIKNSICFGVYQRGKQVGFARVITDRATFAYLADVFVDPAHRGHGLGKKIVRAILAHRDLQGLRRILLATLDAHGLYAQFGFQSVPKPEIFMTIHEPDVYTKNRSHS